MKTALLALLLTAFVMSAAMAEKLPEPISTPITLKEITVGPKGDSRSAGDIIVTERGNPDFAFDPLYPKGSNMNPVASVLRLQGDALYLTVFATTRGCTPYYEAGSQLMSSLDGQNWPALGVLTPIDLGGLNGPGNTRTVKIRGQYAVGLKYRLAIVGVLRAASAPDCIVGTVTQDNDGNVLADDRLSHYEIIDLSQPSEGGSIIKMDGPGRITFFQERNGGQTLSISKDYGAGSQMITVERPSGFASGLPLCVHVQEFVSGKSNTFCLPIQ